MKSYITLSLSIQILLLACVYNLESCQTPDVRWAMKPIPIATKWAHAVQSENPWPEYPRPQMKRDDWHNLNGLWKYAIRSIEEEKPEDWDGHILVPYPVESALSGVQRRLREDQNLWYNTTFKTPEKWGTNRILLHFEASDWETTVWLNGNMVGIHRGGYDPFRFDITEFLIEGSTQDLVVLVWDPTDKSSQPRGKQVTNPGGIWYTPSSGIWQTVWLEPVPETCIESIRMIPHIDDKALGLSCRITNVKEGDIIRAVAEFNGVEIQSMEMDADDSGVLFLEEPHLWSPDNPNLYDLKIQLLRNGEIIDAVSSYFGMRKISLGVDEDGYTRMFLNNAFIFQNGPLDQGFWPDGLYTPPTDEAMQFDLEMTKKFGFNMLRKHVKIESRRFYYWCDRMGLLVWQDMPSGDTYIGSRDADLIRSEKSEEQFKLELRRMIETKINHPSIIMWVPFNEGWGQFKTPDIVRLIKSIDPTRLVNNASGWTDRGVGDVLDLHNYPEPVIPDLQENRAIALGEFGGLGYPVPGHTWEEQNWGYRNMPDTTELLELYESFYTSIHAYVNQGLSAAVYTQTTDVETETNGLLTYDRLPKVDPYALFMANKGYTPPRLENQVSIFLNTYQVHLATGRAGSTLYYTTDGSEPDKNSSVYNGQLVLNESTILKTFAAWGQGKRSRVVTYSIEKVDPWQALTEYGKKDALQVDIYRGAWASLPDFDSLTTSESTSSNRVDLNRAPINENFGLVFNGYLNLQETGIYTFVLGSDDGSRLYIDDQLLIDNDGIHGNIKVDGSVALEKGFHKLRAEYFQHLGGLDLKLDIFKTDNGKRPIDPHFTHD